MSVTKFRTESRLPSMVSSLHDALIDTYNQAQKIGHIDKACSQIVIGFASSAVISLKCTGNLEAAAIFESLGKSLQKDWTAFEPAIKAAHLKLKEFD